MTGPYIMLAMFQEMKAIRECLRIRINYFTPFGKDVSLQQGHGIFIYTLICAMSITGKFLMN